MSQKFNFGGSVLSGGVEGFVISMLQSIGNVAQEKGAEYIKSRMWGFGTNDEKLFLSACTYALETKEISKENLLRVLKIVGSYPKGVQSRIVVVIGGEEEEVAIETELPTKKGERLKTKKVSRKANVKGAKILAMLGRMEDDEIKEVLERSGSTKIFMETLRKDSQEHLKKSVTDFNSDAKRYFAKETWLQKKLREAKEKQTKSMEG